ncbi:unnamed protein product, partial [Aphanomyces euteiches]
SHVFIEALVAVALWTSVADDTAGDSDRIGQSTAAALGLQPRGFRLETCPAWHYHCQIDVDVVESSFHRDGFTLEASLDSAELKSPATIACAYWGKKEASPKQPAPTTPRGL